MPRKKRPIDQDSPVNDQDPIDQDPVPAPEPTPEPVLNDGREDTVKCVVMSATNIVLDCQKTYRNPMGKVPFRGVVDVPREEYESICALDEAAGREHRLMAI